jgi:hypothetical protein
LRNSCETRSGSPASNSTPSPSSIITAATAIVKNNLFLPRAPTFCIFLVVHCFSNLKRDVLAYVWIESLIYCSGFDLHVSSGG